MRKELIKLVATAALACSLIACSQAGTSVAGKPWNLFTARSSRDTIWHDMRYHMTLNTHTERPEVQRQLRWLKHHRHYFYRVLTSSAPYIYYVYNETRKRHMPAELALLPFVESEYQPFAYSHAGALGLWQLMPGTASGRGIKINYWYDGRRDVVDSTKAALGYISDLHDKFHDNWVLAVAAYDAGGGAVHRAYKANLRNHRSTRFWHLHLPRETSSYVPKLLAIAEIIKHPRHYGMHLPPISNEPYLQTVTINTQIDLKQASRMAGINPQMMRVLNPGFRRWATSPDGKTRLMLPIDKADLFKQNYALLPKSLHVTWRYHTVKKDETLLSIAKQYHTTTKALVSVNQLYTRRLKTGQSLLIPQSFKGRLTNKITRKHITITADHIPGPKRYTYRVKKGDTFSKIAAHYHVKPQEIRFWNNLSKHHHLRPKERLTIWKAGHLG